MFCPFLNFMVHENYTILHNYHLIFLYFIVDNLNCCVEWAIYSSAYKYRICFFTTQDIFISNKNNMHMNHVIIVAVETCWITIYFNTFLNITCYKYNFSIRLWYHPFDLWVNSITDKQWSGITTSSVFCLLYEHIYLYMDLTNKPLLISFKTCWASCYHLWGTSTCYSAMF